MNTNKFISFLVCFLFVPFNSGVLGKVIQEQPRINAKNKQVVFKNNDKKISQNSKTSKKPLIALGISASVILAGIAATLVYRNSDNFFQRQVIGDEKDIRNISNENQIINQLLNSGIKSELISTGDLKGYMFSSNKTGKLTGKCVVFYSGSGGTNLEQVKNVLATYTDLGATVICIDYSGFGKSGEPIPSGKIKQKGIFKNGQEIYDFAKKKLNLKDSDMVLHGFSLGGSVAAYVASYVSGKLSGVILQSPIKNVPNAASGTLEKENIALRTFGMAGSYLIPDQFDTEKQLKKLSKKDPDLPISLCTGNHKDSLNKDQTKMDVFLKENGFKNVTIYVGDEGHEKNSGAPVENLKLPEFRLS